jgi:protein-S-isoprenylcysteine O-methyltransferase Ste14
MGLILLLLGESIAFGSLPLLSWWATFTIVNVVYIRLWEEPGLRIRFGEEYARYCSQVGAWLPSRRPWQATNNMGESA